MVRTDLETPWFAEGRMVMNVGRTVLCQFLALGLLVPLPHLGAETPSADFRPDPASVQRYGPAYRYPQAGWIVLHIEGEPYERGYQHGRLLAPEIAAFVRCSAALVSPKAPAEGWRTLRPLVNALFVRRYDKEYLEEMRGIADGASAVGARFDARPIDLVDVAALNGWPEIETLPSALEATPTGLEGIRFPHRQPRTMPDAKPMHCSAFAATGPATADGKVVFGHITMFGLYPSLFYNVWLDVKPAKGHRVLMQTYPAGIQSGMDYYLNDAGLVVCETTIAQTRFDIKGMTVASRIRQTLQYADSIDKAVEILQASNNGLYTNEWLLADIKTNEIAMYELGTAKSKLYRSSKQEWFGGTEGFYWGCNNTKDLDVRLETVASSEGAPANIVWRPADRDKTWLQLYHRFKGKIDADFGKIAFTTPPVAAFHSLDAKFTTTDLAKDLKTWALFGPPLGRPWKPTQEERQRYPEIRPLVSNPWTILHTAPPANGHALTTRIADLPQHVQGHEETFSNDKEREHEDKAVATVPAWHGTLLPKTDADAWLAAAFADYEKIVALERGLQDQAADGGLTAEERERLAVERFAHRSNYELGTRVGSDFSLERTHADIGRDDWYRVAAGKGLLLLNDLRHLLGVKAFEDMMDAFGRMHAGKDVTSAEFQAYVEKSVGAKRVAPFFEFWLKQPGLPSYRLDQVAIETNSGAFKVTGVIHQHGPPVPVPVTVETTKGEVTKTITLASPKSTFNIRTEDRPQRVVVDKYNEVAKSNGGPFSVLSFLAELDQTLIVYGTADEEATNRETAKALQRALIERGPNIMVPIKSDAEVGAADLRSHHLLLIGRPDSNRCIPQVSKALPVTFGSRSFTIGRDTYAHAGSAVVVAAENSLDRRYSVVVLAGLSAEATLHIPMALAHRGQHAGELLLLAHGSKPRALIVPARELVHIPDTTVAKNVNRR
jgi:hypothetical protein